MRKSGALWGTLLIFIGLAWILSSANVVRIDIIGSIMTLWPIFIIAAGVTCFFKRESYIPRIILWLLVFAVIFGYGVYSGLNNKSGTDQNKTFPMDSGIKSASLEVNIGGADFDIGAFDRNLADISTNIKGIHYNFDGDVHSRIEYSQKMKLRDISRGKRFKADLNREIPWDIELNTGSTKGTLNFRDLVIKKCTINTGACNLVIFASAEQSESIIVINGGAVNLTLNLPEDTGLKITSSTAVTRINGSVKMLKEDRIYHSDNYESAANKLYLDITAGLTNITVNR